MRYDPVIATFARRVADAGKPFKLVVTAALRKLLVILNTIIKTQSPWTMPICVAQYG
jgi:transposase